MQFIPAVRAPGHFQASLTADQIISVCRHAFGSETRVESAKELTSGFFNTTYIIEMAGMQRLILRVAPAPGSRIFPNERNLMRREYALQPFLLPVCPVAPKTVWADFTHQIIGRDYILQTFIEGEVWGQVRDSLTEEENNAIRRQLGSIARRINSVTGAAFGFPSPDPGFARWSEALVDFLGGMHQNLVEAGLACIGSDRLLEWVAAHPEPFDQIRTPHLMHGDIYPQNVLLQRKPGGPEIVGLIDSERAMWGDPMFEWVYNLGKQQPAYWEGYGPYAEPEGAELRALAYKGIWQVLVWMEQQRFGSDASWVREALPKVLAELPQA